MPRPTPLLFLVADTGGGHRSAARAVADALDRSCPGRFQPVLFDPLSGPRSAWLLRRVTRLYGPVIRRAPWAWGAAYRVSDSTRVMRLLGRTLLRLAERPVIEAAAALRPAALVSFHPLATPAAVAAATASAPACAAPAPAAAPAAAVAPPAGHHGRDRPRVGPRGLALRPGGPDRRAVGPGRLAMPPGRDRRGPVYRTRPAGRARSSAAAPCRHEPGRSDARPSA